MPLTESDSIRIRQFLQRMESGLVEGMQVYVTYHDSNLAAVPSDPTGGGTTGGWHRLPTEASNWMSVKTALKDTLGTWGTPIRVFGLQGTETAGVGLSADIPKLAQITFIGDGSSKVGWTPGTVTYGGSSYAIDVKAVGDGSTDAYIYWDDADGQTSFKTTGTFATAIAAHHWVVCINDSGKAIPATSHRILHGGLIQADTITASQILVVGLDGDGKLDLGEIGAGDASDVPGAATAAELALIKASLLANWRLDIADVYNRPAGIYPTMSIIDFSQVDWLDSGKAEIKILSTPDTIAGYGFPAIPIDDKQKYTVIIRHKSSAASADGLTLAFDQYNAALPSTKTHIGTGGGTNCQARTNYVNVVSNGAMPGTSWTVDTYTYTPTAGTKYASFNMYQWDPTEAGVEYHVDYVLMYLVPKDADQIDESATKKWAGETGADVTGDHQGDISLANLDEKSVDSLVDGTYAKMLAAWKKAGDVTKIDGGQISTGTVLAAAIATYNLTAVNAVIENLMVKTAHIDNLNVTTPKIDDNATKILVISATLGTRECGDSCGEDCDVPSQNSCIVQSAVITSLGNSIEYTVQFEVTDVGGTCGAVWLTATTVGILKGWPDVTLGKHSYTGYTTPGSGAKTFQLRACRIIAGTSIKIKERLIRLTEDLGK